jgi:hypothetical protein
MSLIHIKTITMMEQTRFSKCRFAETGPLYPSSKPSTATSQSEYFSNATTMSTVSQYKFQCGNQQILY